MKTRTVQMLVVTIVLFAVQALGCEHRYRVPVPGTYHLLKNFNWVVKGDHKTNNTVGDYDWYKLDGTPLGTIENQGTDSEWTGTNVIPASYTGSQCNFYSSEEGCARYDVESCGDFPDETDYDTWLVLWY